MSRSTLWMVYERSVRVLAEYRNSFGTRRTR